jgi:uncharacterized membrane protein YdbT with pleckstrin-like domain
MTDPPSIKRYLLPAERLITHHRMHPVMLLFPLGLLVSSLIAAGILTASDDQSLVVSVTWTIWGIILAYFLLKVLEWKHSWLAVTTHRIMQGGGTIFVTIMMIPFTRITSVNIDRSTLGQILGYASIRIETSSRDLTMDVEHVVYPEQVYLRILAQQHRNTPSDAPDDQASPQIN